ncbi:septum formation inhibitor Maf [Ulvibacter antarcticus]|uniref:Septum formation inhibitor Maf n=1 Tax=Ulvibacter antarcticus TaxID=442714 RepID=A0A3L9Z2P7_9FLAO|nr:septum formation inhibitor Maf [Ulvibacter antarcticus]RMA64575.1 hypothetical protein BXY75_1451 [Ulvibacter antarcticus]
MTRLFIIISFILAASVVSISCKESEHNLIPESNQKPQSTKDNEKKRNLSEAFKNYWYQGEAEITSYQLQQARYGEIHEGTAVSIYVTEDFLPKEQVKANAVSSENTAVLKLNLTKNFVTGIYPYSIMSSTFSPVNTDQNAIKISTSVQEWCGQSYLQLNTKKEFEIKAHSYFEGEADQSISLPQTWLENDLWNRIRLNPEELPTGNVSIIPSFEFLRLGHKEIKAYPAVLSLKQGDSLSIYKIEIPELERNLSIYFSSDFPYEIEKWEETSKSGFGPNAEALTTTAIKLKRIKSAYWTKNRSIDRNLRDSLGLK